MKISNKQALMLFEIAKGSLSLYDRKDVNIFNYTYQQRLDLINQILNQQNNKIIDLED